MSGIAPSQRELRDSRKIKLALASRKSVTYNVKTMQNDKNASLFADETWYTGLVASLNGKIKAGPKADDCSSWLGRTYPGKNGVQNIIRYGSYPYMNAQKLLHITQNAGLRELAAKRGSVACPRVVTTCDNFVCMNAKHLIEH